MNQNMIDTFLIISGVGALLAVIHVLSKKFLPPDGKPASIAEVKDEDDDPIGIHRAGYIGNSGCAHDD